MGIKNHGFVFLVNYYIIIRFNIFQWELFGYLVPVEMH